MVVVKIVEIVNHVWCADVTGSDRRYASRVTWFYFWFFSWIFFVISKRYVVSKYFYILQYFHCKKIKHLLAANCITVDRRNTSHLSAITVIWSFRPTKKLKFCKFKGFLDIGQKSRVSTRKGVSECQCLVLSTCLLSSGIGQQSHLTTTRTINTGIDSTTRVRDSEIYQHM